METPELFNEIAAHYDKWSNVLSGEGIRAWHRFAVDHMHLGPGLTVLDVGCGTGTATCMMAKAIGPEGHVVGLDPSSAMLTVAKSMVRRYSCASVEWVLGTGENLPFDDNVFDRVTAQFSLRNMNHWTEGLQEMVRVLKQDGQLTILEMVQPTTALGTLARNSLGAITAKISDATLTPYQWLGLSLDHAPTAGELRQEALRQGIHDIASHRWLGDLVVELHGRKRLSLEPYKTFSPYPALVWALDGSITALQGASWINAFISAGTRVHLVTIMPKATPAAKIRDTDRTAWRRHHRTAEGLLTAGRFLTQTHMVEGNPGRMLIELVAETQSQMILMGDKQARSWTGRRMGRIVRYVSTHSPVPVVIIPPMGTLNSQNIS